jgi:MATE family multidrug resistance protein
MLAQIALSTTDIVMMGWLGPEKLAGGALGVNFLLPFFLFGLGVVIATSALIAQALGAGREAEVRRYLRQGLWAGLAIAVPFGFILWWTDGLLGLLGQSAVIAGLANDYMRGALWCLAPALGLVTLRAFVVAHSRPRAVLLVTLAGILVNALGNYMLMFGHFGFPRLELFGAGLSTTLVNIFMFASLLLFVLRDRDYRRYHLLQRFWRADWPRFREIFAFGIPISLSALAGMGMFTVASLIMGVIGTEALAAHAIAFQCASIAFMIPLAISQTATVRLGLAAGARDAPAARLRATVAVGLGASFAVLVAALFLLAPDVLIGLFLRQASGDLEVIAALAGRLLVIAAVLHLADAFYIINSGILRGLKDTRMPLLFALIGFWGLGVPASLTLAFGLDLGASGVWLGLTLGIYTAAAAGFWWVGVQLKRLARRVGA